MPAAAHRIQQLHKTNVLTLASLMDMCAVFAHANLASCQAIADACWRHCSLNGALLGPIVSPSRFQIIPVNCLLL